MDDLVVLSFFRYYCGRKVSFELTVFKKHFFKVYTGVEMIGFLFFELDEETIFGGIFGYGDWYLDFLFCHSKVFRRHLFLRYAVGAVRSQTFKSLGYRYMIGRGKNSYVLGHVTGLLFCLFVKLFRPSILNSVSFEAVALAIN